MFTDARRHRRPIAAPRCFLPLLRILGLLLLQAAILIPAATATEVVFDNFGPAWDYNSGLGWTIAGLESNNPFGVEQAMGFMPTTGGPLQEVVVAIAYVPFDPGIDVVTMRLATDDSGRPGTVLQEWVLTEFENWSQWNPPIHLAGDGAEIEADTLYWLWAVPNDTTWTMWNMNNVGDVGPHTLRREGENWLPVGNETRSVFQVSVGTPLAVTEAAAPRAAGRLAAWPNPASGDMRIHYRSPLAPSTAFEIFDVQGRRVRTLTGGGRVGDGFEIVWDGRDQNGRAVAAGVYWVRLAQPDGSQTLRLVRSR